MAETSERAMIQFSEFHNNKSGKKNLLFLIPERILKMDCSHPTPEIPLLKCLLSALTLLFPSCPAGFQAFVSNWCFMYLDYRSTSLRKSTIMHSSPAKSAIQYVCCVRVCARWATLLSVRKKKKRQRENRALTCKSLLLLYLPPLISSIATRIQAVMRRTHRLTALSCLNGCSWHILHVHTQTHAHKHTHEQQRVIREKSRRCMC